LLATVRTPPSNKMGYDYKVDRSLKIGDLNFIHDVKAHSGYPGLTMNDPGSDGTAMARLAAAHRFRFPKRVARVRLFFLPTPDRRTKLMIIYEKASSWMFLQVGFHWMTFPPMSQKLWLNMFARACRFAPCVEKQSSPMSWRIPPLPLHLLGRATAQTSKILMTSLVCDR